MNFNEFKTKLLSDPEVKNHYDEMASEFETARQKIKSKELREVMGVDHSKNNVKLTKKLTAKLNAAFTGKPHSGYSSETERWFTVWDEYANDLLSKLIPLTTEGMPCYVIGGNSYLVWFDWSIQKFIVSV